jgi:hypothetical protein
MGCPTSRHESYENEVNDDEDNSNVLVYEKESIIRAYETHKVNNNDGLVSLLKKVKGEFHEEYLTKACQRGHLNVVTYILDNEIKLKLVNNNAVYCLALYNASASLTRHKLFQDEIDPIYNTKRVNAALGILKLILDRKNVALSDNDHTKHAFFNFLLHTIGENRHIGRFENDDYGYRNGIIKDEKAAAKFCDSIVKNVLNLRPYKKIATLFLSLRYVSNQCKGVGVWSEIATKLDYNFKFVDD